MTATGHGLADLPLEAQGPVSAALGGAAGGYGVVGLRANNPAQRLNARFDAAGVTVTAGEASLRLRLVGYGRASTTVKAITPVAPAATANRVTYRQTGIRQWYANGPLGLEQGFDLSAPPARGRGPVTLHVRVGSNLEPELRGRDVVFTGAAGSLRYHGLVASDATGRTLRSWLTLSRGGLVIHVDEHGARYPLRVDPFVQGAELTDSAGVAGELLGASVAVDGDTIVAGALSKAVGSNADQGAVFVFVRPASGWANATQTALLTAPDGAAGDFMGSVAISGDTIVAGAADRTVENHAQQGAAYVFVKPAAGWTDAHQTAELIVAGGQASDVFGADVAISGDTIVASAPGESPNGAFDRGAAYVFVKPDSGWTNATQTARLSAIDGAAGDSLGQGNGVAISGDTVVLGAAHHKVGSNAEQGVAYVYVKPDAGWSDMTQATELSASDGAAADLFGFAVSISGDTVAVGALHHLVGLTRSGAAYEFSKPAAGWFQESLQNQTAELTPSDGATNDRFGAQLSVSGNRIIVGSFLHQVGDNVGQGAVYVYDRPGPRWLNMVETNRLTAPDGTAHDALSDSVALSGNLVVAGTPLRTIAGKQAQGRVDVFGPAPTVTIVTPAQGATFVQGTRVLASFTCTPPAGATITGCTGTAAAGAALETTGVGQHTFTAVAHDSDGLSASQTVTYAVSVKPSGPPKAPKLTITALRQSTRVWRQGRGLARVARGKTPVGTTFSFSLNQPATVSLSFTRTTRDRRGQVHRRGAGALRVRGHAGADRIAFQGRISATSRLAPGQYSVRFVATSGRQSSNAAKSLVFKIVK
ncbi:MAG: hypothetical protein ACJ76X_13485 [Solirubrobacteraceae bacterium]